MTSGSDDLLFGRIALHYKLVTREQLVAAAEWQAREGSARRLGEILVERGVLTPQQLEQLLAVQREYVAKQQAQTAAAVAAPEPAAPGTPSLRDFALDAPRGLDRLLAHTLRSGASDLHVHSGAAVKLR
ncbi:MAG TPA: hypothetical protein VFC23_02780, partial [Thermoanaerobaculia bacterium]|nr:hypothetical protein [Thermoanaerobaculia bacterium]